MGSPLPPPLLHHEAVLIKREDLGAWHTGICNYQKSILEVPMESMNPDMLCMRLGPFTQLSDQCTRGGADCLLSSPLLTVTVVAR